MAMTRPAGSGLALPGWPRKRLKTIGQDTLYKLYSPDNEMDLAFIKSLLEADEIHYYVHNDHFGSLSLGPKIGLLNAKTIFVRAEDAQKATAIVAGYLAEQGKTDEKKEERRTVYTWPDRIRVILELVLFWWFIPPGRRWRRKPPAQETR